jgi:hypothetical protein
MIISRSTVLRMRNILGKICTENQNTVCPIIFSENRAVYEITWENMIQPDCPQTNSQNM